MTEVSASQTIEKIKTHFREASVGHADPGVPRKNLRTCRGGYQPPAKGRGHLVS